LCEKKCTAKIFVQTVGDTFDKFLDVRMKKAKKYIHASFAEMVKMEQNTF